MFTNVMFCYNRKDYISTSADLAMGGGGGGGESAAGNIHFNHNTTKNIMFYYSYNTLVKHHLSCKKL